VEDIHNDIPMATKKIKQHLATVTILVKDRQTHARDVNDILTKHGHIVMARLGVNVQPLCLEHCTGFITLAVKGSALEIRQMTRDLDKLYGIVAKTMIMTE
jgi:metal-responsive CopG/Arc/MetJ family transcriptional regulator